MNDKVTIKNETGEKEYYKLMQFYSDKTKKRYLLYTDKEYTDGLINVYCSIIEEDGDMIKFKKISKEDEEIVNKVIIDFRNK